LIRGYQRVEIKNEILIGTIGNDTNGRAGETLLFAEAADDSRLHLDGRRAALSMEAAFLNGRHGDAGRAMKRERACAGGGEPGREVLIGSFENHITDLQRRIQRAGESAGQDERGPVIRRE
jgi:hypothetical protein